MPNFSSFIVTSFNVTFPVFFTITAYSIVSFTSAFPATLFPSAFTKLDVFVTFTPSVLSTTGVPGSVPSVPFAVTVLYIFSCLSTSA